MEKYARSYSTIEKELARLRVNQEYLRKAIKRMRKDSLDKRFRMELAQENQGRINALEWVLKKEACEVEKK